MSLKHLKGAGTKVIYKHAKAVQLQNLCCALLPGGKPRVWQHASKIISPPVKISNPTAYKKLHHSRQLTTDFKRREAFATQSAPQIF